MSETPASPAVPAAPPAESGAWRRRGAFAPAVLRVLLVWFVTACALLLASAILPGVTVEDRRAAVVAAAVIGLVNALLWPLAIRLLVPITVLTLGLGALVLNGLVVLLASAINPGLEVNTLRAAIAAAFVLTVVNTIVTSLLALDDDDFYYRNVIRRQARRSSGAVHTEVPGVLFLEIDGLAHDVLTRAMRDGNAPTMAGWLHEGTHTLARWETDWSSQTGACQAGLLHGDNDDMCAFRWWEKDRNAAIVTNRPRDAMELERRHSNGRGLLFADGASRANILSGDAPHTLLTMSTVLRRDRPGRIGQDYFAYFANPYNVTRTVALITHQVVIELWSAAQQRRLDVRPRVRRSFSYALIRAWATVVQRDLQVAAVIADMYAGRPVTYTTFLAYDEVAHHSGIERPETLVTLRGVDRQLRRIAVAAAQAPRPYRLVALSDHGQSQGATFRDRYGTTLEELVNEAAGAQTVAADGHPDEARAYLSASLAEAAGGETAPARALRSLKRPEGADGSLRPVDGELEVDGDPAKRPPEVVVMASGCLGLISFPREPGRLSVERLDALYPGLVPALRDHPGIGFLLVRSERRGAMVIGSQGVNYLDEGQVEGADPLAAFGPRAARHVKRTDGFAHCPDIVVNSTYWAHTDEVAAFEQLVGSHGGMGGSQSFPFILHPADLELPDEALVGAEAVHRELRRWLAQLGHHDYLDEAG